MRQLHGQKVDTSQEPIFNYDMCRCFFNTNYAYTPSVRAELLFELFYWTDLTGSQIEKIQAKDFLAWKWDDGSTSVFLNTAGQRILLPNFIVHACFSLIRSLEDDGDTSGKLFINQVGKSLKKLRYKPEAIMKVDSIREVRRLAERDLLILKNHLDAQSLPSRSELAKFLSDH